ncbi:MAG: hypothetical protein JNL11_07330 [Bdellovibrionaceae bacterium]|nr:hypothetical protein [Pseudobdellovibrionaceae bacterium]
MNLSRNLFFTVFFIASKLYLNSFGSREIAHTISVAKTENIHQTQTSTCHHGMAFQITQRNRKNALKGSARGKVLATIIDKLHKTCRP